MKLKVSVLNLQDKEIRLQVYLARCGVASRRSAEAIILDRRISVNNVIIDRLGTKVFPGDLVCFDGKEIYPEEKKRYVLLYKPSGYVCSLSDEKNRQTAWDLLKPHFTERLYNVGRLDMFSEGLILFTNDGEFAQKLSHPSSQTEKEYIVEGSLPIPPVLIEKFQKGIRIDNVFYKCKSAELLGRRRARIVLIEGKNREIRNVFDEFNIGIKLLARIRIAHIKSEGLLQGQFRELTDKEVALFQKT
ncbi:MAG: pseudouridine synthase [Spirochaetales bacterium]